MPISNALIQATPRNALLGGVSDFLAQSYSPERTQHMQGIAKFLSAPEISRTLDKLSYGEPLTTGAGGLGGTTRFNNDALDAMMAVAPMVGPTAKVFNNSALTVGRAGERLAEKVVPQIMQRGGLPAEMLGAMGNRTVSPLDVYHGTPHTLPPTPRNPLGEFDASKIGTGEGAQVYGHGIYTAENPAVAQGYKDTLAYKAFDISPEAEKLGFTLNAGARGEFMRQSRVNKSPEAKARSLQNANIAARDVPQEKLAELFKAYEERGGGNLYKIDLPDEKVAKMLDWDKPMSEQQMIDIYDKMQQSPLASFAKPFQDNFYERMNRGQSTTDGQDLFIELSKQLGGQKQVSDFLRSIDIPGIKYLDASSRGTGGTRNFVVFPGEEKSMTILERNGQKFDNSALMK